MTPRDSFERAARETLGVLERLERLSLPGRVSRSLAILQSELYIELRECARASVLDLQEPNH